MGLVRVVDRPDRFMWEAHYDDRAPSRIVCWYRDGLWYPLLRTPWPLRGGGPRGKHLRAVRRGVATYSRRRR
jgi:hypothetical protein